jgi:hypothetical protein
LWRHEYVTGRDLVAGGGYHTYDAFVEMDALVLLYSQSSQIMANIILKDIQRERLLLDTRESQLMRNTGTWVAREGIIQGAFSNETLAVILTGSDGVTYRFLLQKKDNKYSWRLQKPVGSGEKPVPAECIPASVIPQQSLKSHGVKPPEAGKQ